MSIPQKNQKISRERPELHFGVHCLPHFLLKTLHICIKYSLKYLLLAITLVLECKRVYAFSTKSFSGGLGYDYEQDIGNLSKLPRHMSFVINEDVTTDYFDIANLIVWTVAMGIPYISLYDRHGILKAGEERLRKIVKVKAKHLIDQRKSEGMNIILKDSSYKYQNGINYPKNYCVQLLAEEDGKADVVEAAKRISTDFCDNNVKLKDINIDYVNNSLKAIENIPDPELVIQFGSVYSLQGFLPWQTRLSEILNVKTHKKMTYRHFYDLLLHYSNCSQRFGK